MSPHAHLPRSLSIGPVCLDLFHRDARVYGQWLRLFPKEFALLWRLAEDVGRVVRKPVLLNDVWRLQLPSESNRVEVHISRIRAKLHVHRLAWLIQTDPEGGYRLIDPDNAIEIADARRPTESLDSHRRTGNGIAKIISADK